MSIPSNPAYTKKQPISTQNNKFPAEGPKALPIAIEFPQAGTATIDLLEQTNMGRISQIQGAWIDNTDGPNLILECDVTNQVIHIATGMQGYLQLLSANPPTFRLTSDAATTKDVLIHFLNFPVIHSLVNVLGGGGGGIESIVPGTGISVDDTDPANPVVSATGGGGGGKAQYTQLVKIGAGQSFTLTELDAAAFTPWIVTNASNIDLTGFDPLVGNYLLTVTTLGAPCTLTNPTGSNLFDKTSTPASSISIAADETVDLIIAGDGSNWTGYVVGRY